MAYKFRRDLNKASNLAAQERLASKYPGLYWAWYWRSQDDENAKTRWTIEAYLCSGATFAQIAKRTGEHPAAVGCYANIFFDVVGKTKHWMWVLNEVIGESVHRGISDRQPDLLWKLYGLLCGPLFLDMLIRQDGVPVQVTSYAQGSSVNDGLIRSSLQTKALYAARSIPTYESEIIFAAYQKMKEIEASADNPQKAHGTILDSIHVLTQKVGFVFGHKAVESLDIKHYDTDGVEFRANDLVATAFGEKPPKLISGPMPEHRTGMESAHATTDQG